MFSRTCPHPYSSLSNFQFNMTVVFSQITGKLLVYSECRKTIQKSLLTNYRPMSIFFILIKEMETVINRSILCCFKSINDKHYGFRHIQRIF